MCGLRGRIVTALLSSLSLVGVATGCGGGGSSSKQPATNALVLNPGSAPTASQCGFDQLRGSATSARGKTLPPAPGAYGYTTQGSESVPGQTGRLRPLPRTSDSLVTPVRRSGGLTCFGMEHRHSPSTRTANVYVLRGEDIYIVAVGFTTPSYVQTVLPRPAILALSGTSTRWSGSFSGRTSGTYQVEIAGRRTIRVGGRSVKVVQLASSATFTGELTGSQKTSTLLATDRSLIVQETGTSNLRFGGDEERLNYRDRLVSLTPGGG